MLPSVKAPARTSQAAINKTAWLAFLAEKESHEGDGVRSFNGRYLSETDNRALHRWRVEGANPDIWRVDKFLVAIGIHLDEFFDWCDKLEVSPWQFGEPQWHTEEPDWEEIDKTWKEP